MKYVAVIPARAGSRGVKNKNTRIVGGLPLFMWSVYQAIDSKHISKIIISSNDETCRNVLSQFTCRFLPEAKDRILFVQRPDELSTDTAISELALIHAVEQLTEKPEFVVMLQPSSPIRPNRLIDRCIDFMEANHGDCLLTASKMPNFFWFEDHDTIVDKWSWFSSYDPRDRKMRQQIGREDFKYFDDGCVYITKTDLLLSTRCRIYSGSQSKICVYPTSFLESMQIDTEEELVQCDAIISGCKTNHLI